MKVGKKALSVFLAVLMFMSSISASFGVFAATTDTDEIFSAIETHYAGLKLAIAAADPNLKEPDKSMVPDGSGKKWTVVRDTESGGWQAVAMALANYIQGTAYTNPTLVAVIDDIKGDIADRVNTYGQLRDADYESVLNYLLFGTQNATDDFGTTPTTINLTIGCGFDLLAWDSVMAMDENRLYSSGVLNIKTKSDGNGKFVLDGEKTVYTSDILEDPANMVSTVGAIKKTLEKCVAADNFSNWFTKVEVNNQRLSDDELNAFAALFNEFTDVVTFAQAGYTPAEVWEHYVSKAVKKTYGETEAFYVAAGAAAKADNFATSLISEFDKLLDEDTSALSEDELRVHYNKYVALVNELNASPYATPTKKAMNEKKGVAYIGSTNAVIEKEMSRLSKEIAKAYALMYADYLKEYAAKAEFAPKFDAQTNKWQKYDEATSEWIDATADDAAAWLYGPNGNDGAFALVSDITTYVLGYATFEDVKDAKTAGGNNVNKDAYDKLSAKVNEISFNLEGADHLVVKSEMDSFMNTVVISGLTFNEGKAKITEFLSLYRQAYELSENDALKAVFERIYGEEGLEPYTVYVNDIKADFVAKAKSYFDLVLKYYGEGSDTATYYNYEAIILTYNTAMATNPTGLGSFLDEVPAYEPDSKKGDITIDEYLSTYNKATAANRDAESFKTNFNNLKELAYTNTAQGPQQANTGAYGSDRYNILDETLLQYILVAGKAPAYGAFSWETCVKKLNYKDIMQLVNQVELKENSSISRGRISELMDLAVEDFDRMLVSDDLGILLKNLTTKQKTDADGKFAYTRKNDTSNPKTEIYLDKAGLKKDSNGNAIEPVMTNLLGKWKRDYTIPAFTDEDGVYHPEEKFYEKNDVKNLREFLISLISDLLYGGMLPTTLFTVLEPAVGQAVYSLAGGVAIILPNYYQDLPKTLRRALPTMPHMFYANWGKSKNGTSAGNITDDTDVIWYKMFNGALMGSRYDYSEVLYALQTAPHDGSSFGTGKELRSYWNDNWTNPRDGHTYRGIPNGVWKGTVPIYQENGEDVYFDQNRAWHMENADDLYHAMAAATAGLAPVLASLVTGNAKKVEVALLDFDITIDSTGQSLYDTVFMPLYRLLGIKALDDSTNKDGYGFYSGAQVSEACDTDIHALDGKCAGIVAEDGYGAELWQKLLEPIINFINMRLFNKPVETILELLPNLVALLEYDQIFPKLTDMNLKVILSLVKAALTDIQLWDLALRNLLGDLGLTPDVTKQGSAGLLNMLLGAKTTSAAPTEETKGKYLVKKDAEGNAIEGQYVKYNGKYVLRGLLTGALYGLAGDGFFDWLKWSGDTGSCPLELPVNRLMSCGTIEKKTLPVIQPLSPRTNYHVATDAGDVLLTLFRWLMDDGVIALLEPLLGGLLGAETFSMIQGIVGGQADTLMAILICLLNDYVMDYVPYEDVAKNNNKFGFWDGDHWVSYIENGKSTFKIGKFLEETLREGNDAITGDTYTDEQLIAKADLAVANADKLINSLVTTLLIALEGTLEGVDILKTLGIEEVIDKVKANADTNPLGLEEVLSSFVLSNSLIEFVVDLLVGTKELVYATDPTTGEKIPATTTSTQIIVDGVVYYIDAGDESGTVREGQYVVSVTEKEVDKLDANGDPVLDSEGNPEKVKEYSLNYDQGLLGGLLGDPNGIVNKLANTLAEIDIDLTPAGFYEAYTTSANVSSSGNTQLAAWMEGQAKKHGYTGSTSNKTQVLNYIRTEMTWADVGYEKDFEWFEEVEGDLSATADNFIEYFCDLITPLNPILAFLLSGQDILLLDELKLQGNNGYSRSIVAILETFGLTTACMSQNQFDNYVYHNRTSDADVDVNALVPAGKKFATTYNSPLRPLLDAIKLLLLGDGNANKSFFDSPLTVLFEKLPNIAYALYIFEDEEGKQRSNLMIAIENLITPVTKLLDVVDPILSKIITLDLNGLIEGFLDIETMLNNILGGIGAEEGTSFNVQMLDFAKLAAESSDINFNAKTYRAMTADDNGTVGNKTWTSFEGSPGKLFITVVRTILTKDIAGVIGDAILNLVGATDEAKDEAEAEGDIRVKNIVNNVIYNLTKDAGPDANGGKYVDIISGIIIDILSDYEPDDAKDFYYEFINNVDNKLTEALQDEAMVDYGIKHQGYDWANKPKDKDGNLLFTEEKVNQTIESIDYVITSAVPEVLSTLLENGVLKGGIFESLDGDDGLWGLVKGLLLDFALKDDSLTAIANLIANLLGSSGETGTTGTIARAVKAAGFDITFDNFLYKKAADGKTYDKDNKKQFFYYVTYLYLKDANGNLVPGASKEYDMYYLDLDQNGEADDQNNDGTIDINDEVELTWAQIYKNHSYIVYDFNENGELVLENGQPKKAAVQVQITRQVTPDVDEETGEVKLDDKGNEIKITEYKYFVLDEDGKATTEVEWLAEAGKTELVEGEGVDAVVKKLTPATKDKKVLDENGEETDEVVYETALYTTAYPQIKTSEGYKYTYTDAEGVEQTHYAPYQQLKVLDSGKDNAEGENIYYTLTPVYSENTADCAWNWGIDNPNLVKPDGSLRDEFTAKKVAFINLLWDDLLSPFEDIFAALFAGGALEFFDGALNIEGEWGYVDFLLPLLRAFGLETIIDQLKNKPHPDYPDDNTKDALDALETKDAWGQKITELMGSDGIDAYKALVYNADGTLNSEMFGGSVKNVINYVLYFAEILCNYPIETLANGLPTLAYFLYADGLTTIVENLLVFLTTLTNRIKPIMNLDLNNIGAGLVDALSTGNWENFQTALGEFIQFDEDGNLIETSKDYSLTESLFGLLANLEFDLSGLLGEEDTYGGKYGLVLFLNADS